MSRRRAPRNVTLGGFGAHVGDLRLARRQAGDRWTRRPQSVVIGFVENGGRAPDHSGEHDVRLELLDLRNRLAEIAAACVERHVDLVQHLAAHLHHQVGHDTVRTRTDIRSSIRSSGTACHKLEANSGPAEENSGLGRRPCRCSSENTRTLHRGSDKRECPGMPRPRGLSPFANSTCSNRRSA